MEKTFFVAKSICESSLIQREIITGQSIQHLCISQFQAPTCPSRATPGVLHSTAAPGPEFILDDLPQGAGFCISIKLRLVQ